MYAETRDWHIQYHRGENDIVERFQTPELAIKAACRLMDAGVEVYGMGNGQLADSVSTDLIATIYALWQEPD
ncbi:MAG: hypothetical protein P4M15_06570 [Alphaproteobacteria bacterium]|nr:hypothetical protein [Alphaproteobacteria bacterium]